MRSFSHTDTDSNLGQEISARRIKVSSLAHALTFDQRYRHLKRGAFLRYFCGLPIPLLKGLVPRYLCTRIVFTYEFVRPVIN